MPQPYLNYLDGHWQTAASGASTSDVNPADAEDVLGIFLSAGRADGEPAVAAAATSFPEWARLPMPRRGEILPRAANLFEARAGEIAEALTREEGETLAAGKDEALRGASILRYYAGETMQPSGEVYPSASAKTFLYADHVPLGVVALITPWNFPVAVPMWKVAPALAFGNTVVFKPAELTPLTAWHLVDVLEKVGLPPGVPNLVVGRGAEASQELVDDRRVKAISFTGSNQVGTRIAAQAVARGAKIQSATGSKNPVVVLADADLQQAVS